MRKLSILLTLLLFAAILLLAGCSGEEALSFGSGDIEITDRFFILQIEEIHLNVEEYLGRTIRYEGMFRSIHWAPTDRYYHYVFRYTDSCCGTGDAIGFEVYFEGDNNMPPVAEDDWVAVAGVLDRYEEDGVSHLRLIVTSITALEERGEEFVSLLDSGKEIL